MKETTDTQLQIDLLFSDQVKLNNSFNLFVRDNKNNKHDVSTKFVEFRKEPFQTVIGANVQDTIHNLRKTLELDYGGIFRSEIVDSGVRLTAIQPNWIFDRHVTNPIDMPIRVIPEDIVQQAFSVRSIEYLPFETDRCNKVIVKVTTSLPMSSYCTDLTCFIYNSNVLEIERQRGSGIFQLDLVRNAQIITLNIMTPPLMEDGYDNIIVLEIINGLNGGSVTVNAPFSSQLQHQFSIDNIAWQESNTFSGLLEGHYTVWIKDKYGCVRSKDFQIDPYTNNIIRSNNFHYLSKSNSIRFARRDPANSHKTDENTLSCEVDVLKPYKQIQVFKPTDVIKTQFKSNYNINKAYVLQDEVRNDLVIQRMTNNLNLKDKRTAIQFNLQNGKTGIYFISGIVFDYDTGAAIETYQLNGNLPEWAKKGNRFQKGDAWFQIIDTYFDTNKNAEVIVINNVYTSTEFITIVAAQYNRENYNVFEFSVSMQNYLNSAIRVGIEFAEGETIFDQKIKYLSEEINVKSIVKDMVEIRYKNTRNTDVLYSTRIEHLLRIPIEYVSGKDIGTSENYKTDDKVTLLEANIYESNEFRFEPLTKEMWRKLKIALSHDTVYIDGVGYVLESDFETEGPLGQTNLYILTAKMIKNGHSYSNRPTNDIIIIDDSPMTEVPGFINVDPSSFLQI
ncbi:MULTISPECIES: hypothetical protein [unclassified Myroides]|uniref:hypothetical protein n=1 Tax=unclassified Myroides TaxID=2642485 RepID=UPI003D2F6525